MSTDRAQRAAEKILVPDFREAYPERYDEAEADMAAIIRVEYADLEAKVAELESELSAAILEHQTVHAEALGIKEEVERLRTIVRVRTHRENGCLCEQCVESEYNIAAEYEQLTADRDRLAAEVEELKTQLNDSEYWRARHSNDAEEA